MKCIIKKVHTENEKGEKVAEYFALMQDNKDTDIWIIPDMFSTLEEAKEHAKKLGLKVA